MTLARGTQLRDLVELRDVFFTLAGVAAFHSDDSTAPDGASYPLLERGRHGASLMLEFAECNFNGAADGINWVALTDGDTKYIWFMDWERSSCLTSSRTRRAYGLEQRQQQEAACVGMAHSTGIEFMREEARNGSTMAQYL